MLPDNPAMRGMINRVSHLVKWEDSRRITACLSINLKPAPVQLIAKKRRGRGSSSGLGGSAGRGEKGYLARAGSGQEARL